MIRNHAFHLDAKRALQLAEFRALFASEERGSYASSASATGATDAVNEILRDFRQVKVNDMHDVFDVNTARSEISGDQHLVAAFLESSQRSISLRLRAVAMNHGCRKAFAGKILGNAFRSTLGTSEHQAASRLFREEAFESFLFAV